MRLGDFEITALSDGTDMLPAAMLVNSRPEEIHRLLNRDYLADPVETSFNAFLINIGSKLVLIDTGAGDLMGPALGNLPADLKAAGYQAAQVDDVYLTHMHPDHIGGLIVGGQRAFPNAVLHADKKEAAYWLNPKNSEKASKDLQQRFREAVGRIGPYIAAGKFVEFDDGAELQPGIRTLATVGHTPGHTSYVIESRGEKLVVWGDLVHVASVQLPQPIIALKFDYDPQAAMSQRSKALAAAASGGYWIGGAHLPFPGLGHIRTEAQGYAWLPANYGTRF